MIQSQAREFASKTMSDRYSGLPLNLLNHTLMNSARESGTAASNGVCDSALLSGGTQGMESSYLVDPASSHMLVSKIKPCMSKYKQLCTVKLRMAH